MGLQRKRTPSDAVAELESYLTPLDKFRDVSRGSPVPHSLSEEKRTKVGLTRETWRLEVTADPEHPARVAIDRRKVSAMEAGKPMMFPRHSIVAIAMPGRQGR